LRAARPRTAQPPAPASRLRSSASFRNCARARARGRARQAAPVLAPTAALPGASAGAAKPGEFAGP